MPKPVRLTDAAAATGALPDIRFDIGNFIPPAQTEENGVLARRGPAVSAPAWCGGSAVRTRRPAAIRTFAGNASAHVTTAVAGDYFDNGSIQPLSDDILDKNQWFNPLSCVSTVRQMV